MPPEPFEGFAAPAHVTSAVLAEVNAATGRAWQLHQKLPGGYQAGAWLIRDRHGPAVLKWWDQPHWAERVLAAASVIELVRERGYPTPQWLAVGLTDAGYPYEVQAFVNGIAAEALGLTEAAHLIDLVSLQREITPVTTVDWTAHMMEAAFLKEERSVQRLRHHGDEVSRCIDGALQLASPYSGCVLPTHELVHGDLCLGNVLCLDGRVTGVVDIEAVGRGAAVFDLLWPTCQARLWGGDPKAASRLEDHAIDVYGPAAAAIAVATSVMDILKFGAQHWPHDLAAIAGPCEAWISIVRQRLN